MATISGPGTVVCMTTQMTTTARKSCSSWHQPPLAAAAAAGAAAGAVKPAAVNPLCLCSTAVLGPIFTSALPTFTCRPSPTNQGCFGVLTAYSDCHLPLFFLQPCCRHHRRCRQQRPRGSGCLPEWPEDNFCQVSGRRRWLWIHIWCYCCDELPVGSEDKVQPEPGGHIQQLVSKCAGLGVLQVQRELLV